MNIGQLAAFEEKDRKKMAEEVVKFISSTAKTIQALNHQLDYHLDNISILQTQFYQQVISNLLYKLNEFSRRWERLQKQHQAHHVTAARLFSSFYTHHNSSDETSQQNVSSTSTDSLHALSSDHQDRISPISSISPKSSSFAAPPPPTTLLKEDKSFAQRYIDEIAPPAKMQQYLNIANQQKNLLFKETNFLKKKFSQDLLESERLESTVLGISGLVSEFAGLLEGQSSIVEEIGDIAKDVTNSVKDADQELLLTLERTQSQQWNMITLIFILSVMLLILHIITP
jgi:NTP pyrophosphatase (non-canonical NTP hydrolase)